MFASLLVSVLVVGIKLTAGKELVQNMERRKELKANLLLLRRRLEEEDLVDWLDDVNIDTAHRQERIEAMDSVSGHIYSSVESELFQGGMGIFAMFESNDAETLQLKCSASIHRSETKHDKASGRLLGRVEAEIRVKPQEIVAYMLNQDSQHFKSDPESDPATTVRREMLEAVSPFHTILFNRKKAAGILNRTFLNSGIAKKMEDNPLTYVVAWVPIASHDKITSNDEVRAVRAENYRTFRLTEVTSSRTKIEYVCALDLKGSVPQWITNMVAVPQQRHPPKTMQVYFQQLWPLVNCDAEDGRLVGQLLIDLVESKPDDLAHAVRTFVNRMAMLRDCGFRMGQFLVTLLARQTSSANDSLAVVLRDPASVTNEQAAAIGGKLAATLCQAGATATALHKAIESHSVLRTMRSRYIWFLPMLEVLLVQVMQEGGRFLTVARRLTAIVTPNLGHQATEATTEESLIHVASNVAGADAGSFDSVVRSFASSRCTRWHIVTSSAVS